MHPLSDCKDWITKDMNDFTTVNTVYSQFFSSNFPGRSTVAVKQLPKNAKFEIEVTAAYPYPNLWSIIHKSCENTR